jgi:cellulose synthase (UDP-forming)
VPLLMRLHTLDSILYWSIGSVARLCFLVAPILYWWFGIYVMETDATSVLEHLGPSWLCTAIFLGWVSRGTNLPLFVEAMTLLTLFESLRASAIGLFGSKNQKFKVTAKGASRDSVVIHWSLIRWFLLLAALTVGGIVFSTIRGPVAGTPVVVEAVSFFWSVFNIATLLLASLMCVELPRFRGEERFRADEPAEIVADGRRLISRLTDVSVAGARFAVPDGICLPSGTDLRIRLRGVGVIPARVVRGRAGECHVAFQGETGRPALIRKIFSGNLSPAVSRLSMSALLAVVFRRAFG